MCEQSINPDVKAESLRVNFANGWMTEPAATCSPANTTSPPCESYHPCNRADIVRPQKALACLALYSNWCNLLKCNFCCFNTQGSPENSPYGFRNVFYMFLFRCITSPWSRTSWIWVYMANVKRKTKEHPVETVEFKAAQCLVLFQFLLRLGGENHKTVRHNYVSGLHDSSLEAWICRYWIPSTGVTHGTQHQSISPQS